MIFNDFVKHGCLGTTQPAPRLTICFVLMCNNYMDGSGVMNVYGGCLKAQQHRHHNHIDFFCKKMKSHLFLHLALTAYRIYARRTRHTFF